MPVTPFHILAGRYPVHGGFHTLPGALLLSAAVIVPARAVVAVVPLAPWIGDNPLFVAGSFVWMHALCAAAGLLGGVAWYARHGRAAMA